MGVFYVISARDSGITLQGYYKPEVANKIQSLTGKVFSSGHDGFLYISHHGIEITLT